MSKREERESQQAELFEYLRGLGHEAKGKEHKRQARAVAANAGREQWFLEQLTGALKDALAKPLARPLPRAVAKPKGSVRRVLNLLSSDTHFGSNLDPREVGHNFGPVEESRRMAAVCRQVAQYKLPHRDETELLWHVLGDMIQGQLHDKRDGAPLSDQFASCVRILVQALRFFTQHFRKVTVRCVPGNHGRRTDRHHDRAILQKHDAIETMIYVALKEAATFLPNATVELAYSPEYYWDSFGYSGMGTHGDTVLEVGYPNKSVNVEAIATKVDRINMARVNEGKKPLSVVATGHVHIGSLVYLPSGTVSITNSCLIPPDSYAKSKGFFATACGQWIFESTPDHPVGDHRFINVGKADDQDASLSDIISPYEGFDR